MLKKIILLLLMFSYPASAQEGEPRKIQPDDFILGDKNAKVEIIEYASLSCPGCAYFHNKILPVIKEKYIDTGKVKLALRHYPTNEPAFKGALLSYCNPQKHNSFVKVLFETQDKWAFSSTYENSLKNIGKVGGISEEEFNKCMNDEELQKKILQISKVATDELEIKGTPNFLINGKKFEDGINPDSLSKAIDEALKE